MHRLKINLSCSPQVRRTSTALTIGETGGRKQNPSQPEWGLNNFKKEAF